MNKGLILIYKAITPIHAGASEGNTMIDLPIQREANTGFPKIEATTLKGALKDKYKEQKGSKEDEIFGEEGSHKAGQLAFTDAKVLLFPIRSSEGIYKLVTCPFILERFCKESDILIKDKEEDKNNVKDKIKAVYKLYEQVKHIKDNEVIVGKDESSYKKLMLGDYIFKKNTVKEILKDNFILDDLKDRIAVVSDDIFKELVTYYTEVQTRIRIDKDTRTTKNSGLFNEEYLPSETILYSHVIEFKDIYDSIDALDEFNKVVKENFNFTLGGNISLGKGHINIQRVVK